MSASGIAAPRTFRTTMPSWRRARRMVQRNLLVYRHAWMVIVSGFFEPLFYLLGMGFGIGAFVTEVQGVSYAAFIAPGLLASSCMNGAISDGFFNIYFKLHYQKTYEGIMATPMRVADIAFGEMLWALTRASLYAGTFLLVMLGLGELKGPRMLLTPLAVLAFPAAILVAASFSSMALCLASLVRKVEEFDIVMGLIVMPMFLFSGIFFPVDRLPDGVQWVFQAVPLFHAVELLRGLTLGVVTPAFWWHMAYLSALGTVAFVVAMRRLERTLIK